MDRFPNCHACPLPDEKQVENLTSHEGALGSHRAYDRSWCRLSGGAGSTELQCQGQVKRACTYLEPGFWFKVAPSAFLRLIREMRCKLVELFLCNDILVRVHGPTYVRGRGLYLSRKLTFSWSCFWPFNFLVVPPHKICEFLAS